MIAHCPGQLGGDEIHAFVGRAVVTGPGGELVAFLGGAAWLLLGGCGVFVSIMAIDWGCNSSLERSSQKGSSRQGGSAGCSEGVEVPFSWRTVIAM